MRVMVTGAMLGQEVVGVLAHRGHEVVPVSHAALDITSLDKVRETVAGREPDAVINCAAYTATAESDWERALAVNCLGPRNLPGERNSFAAVEHGLRF